MTMTMNLEIERDNLALCDTLVWLAAREIRGLTRADMPLLIRVREGQRDLVQRLLKAKASATAATLSA